MRRTTATTSNEEAGPSTSRDPIPAIMNWRLPVTYGFYGHFMGGSINKEFELLKKVDDNTLFTTSAGKRDTLLLKNRDEKVLPYDQTRVVLQGNFMNNFYINASFIKPAHLFDPTGVYGALRISMDTIPHKYTYLAALPPSANLITESLMTATPYTATDMSIALKLSIFNDRQKKHLRDKNKLYIATQGCLCTSVVDFWRMVVENDVRIIIMLGGMIEKGRVKCILYWPRRNGIHIFGDAAVVKVEEQKNEYYEERSFDVKVGSNPIVRVRQYQYMAWKEGKDPSNMKHILEFIEMINRELYNEAQGINPPKKNILCCHASNGIGRTGTFIALNTLIDKVMIHGRNTHIDIFATVRLLRYQRAGMVETFEQYTFLYRAMREYMFMKFGLWIPTTFKIIEGMVEPDVD